MLQTLVHTTSQNTKEQDDPLPQDKLLKENIMFWQSNILPPLNLKKRITKIKTDKNPELTIS